jgi:hypothetical protein
MDSTKQPAERRRFIDILLKIGYGVTLLCTAFVLWFAYLYISDGDLLYQVISIGFAAFYILLASALVMLIRGKALNKTLRFMCKTWVAIVLLVFLLLGYGVLKDAMGAYCSGFFGVQTSCLDSQYLLVFVLFVIPYSTLAWLGLSLIVLSKGWYEYFASRRAAAKQIK